MIEAGASVIACYSGRQDDPAEAAIEVFRAMMEASRETESGRSGMVPVAMFKNSK